MEPIEATALLAFFQTAAINDNPFDMPQARFFIVTTSGEVKLMLSTPDVYLGLSVLPAAYQKLGDDSVIGVETVGWAAPMSIGSGDDDIPSEHPHRRRIRLVAVINRAREVASAHAFIDDKDNVQTCTSGNGTLAEALKECMDRVVLMQSLPRRFEQ